MADHGELLQVGDFFVAHELFTLGYPAGQGPCACSSKCCARGAYADVTERDRILARAEQIKPHMDASQSRDHTQWFEAEEKPDADFPSGLCAGTSELGGKCAFLDQRGYCSLQVTANAAGEHKWSLKPLYCRLFPIDVANRVIRFDTRLQGQEACCSVQATFQVPLFEACREELEHLVGASGFQLMREHYKKLADADGAAAAGAGRLRLDPAP